MPVQAIQTGANPACKLLQTSDHQLQTAPGLMRREGRVPLRPQPHQALLEPSQPRSELVGIDHLFGVAVDQTAHAAAQASHLPLQPIYVLARPAVPRRRRAALVLGRHPPGVVQHRLDLPPHRLLQLVAAHGAVAAGRLAAELVSVRARAAIIAVVGRLPAPDDAPRHFAVERIAALAAHHEALQQPAGRRRPSRLRRRFSSSCACTASNTPGSTMAGTGMAIHSSGGTGLDDPEGLRGGQDWPRMGRSRACVGGIARVRPNMAVPW